MRAVPRKDAAQRAAAAKNRDRRRRPGRDNREPSTRDKLPRGQAGICWCGEPFGHDWAGKDEGKSHPR